MTDATDPAAKQLQNIAAATGKTLADFTAMIADSGLDKHGQIVAFLKAEAGLTHGNANLIAARAREALAGGPASPDALLAAQYAGKKAALRPICDALLAMARGLGDDVAVDIQKTGVALRRKKLFGVVQAPSARRVTLGLNQKQAETGPRLTATSGMCRFRVDLTDASEADDEVARWMADAYRDCG